MSEARLKNVIKRTLQQQQQGAIIKGSGKAVTNDDEDEQEDGAEIVVDDDDHEQEEDEDEEVVEYESESDEDYESDAEESPAKKKSRTNGKVPEADKVERQREKEAKLTARAEAKAERERANEIKKASGLKKKMLAALRRFLKFSRKCKYSSEKTGGAVENVSRTQLEMAFGKDFITKYTQGKGKSVSFEIEPDEVSSMLGGEVMKRLYPYGGVLTLIAPVEVKWTSTSKRMVVRSHFSMRK